MRVAARPQILKADCQRRHEQVEMIVSTISNAMLGRNSINDTFVAAIGRAIKRGFVAYMNWRLQQLAISRLRTMSDRELKDIGVSRSQVEFAVTGKLERHPMFSRYY
jgi:uncharacterized protein YjiS (DUF1127 family)